MDVITVPENLVYRFYCMVLFHSQTRHFMMILSIISPLKLWVNSPFNNAAVIGHLLEGAREK